MDLYGKVGEKTYKNLLADLTGADKISISCTPGNGVVTVGTVMFKDTTGMYTPAATGDVVITKALVVLADTVDTGDTPAAGETAVAEDAPAYRSGVFINGHVTLASGGTLTEAHKVVLKNQGIVFDHKVETAEFDNSVTTPED